MGKSTKSTPALAAVAPCASRQFQNDKELRDQSTLLGFEPSETMEICANVLSFLADFHLRPSDSKLEDDIERGQYYVIRAVEDALLKQVHAMLAVDERKTGVAHG